MKPYNERLPLIDAAVDYCKGVLPKNFCNQNGSFYLDEGRIKQLVDRDYLTVRIICTRTEFNQRAKELGYINGYKYGVEYETNGEKPDLDDDVVIECFDGVEWWGGYNYLGKTNLTPNELTFTGCVTEKFRIVDDRFKPKEQDMNGWYKKGELPPVGSVVEVSGCTTEEMRKWNGESVKVISHEKPTGLDHYVPVVFHPDFGATTIMLNRIRPLRTETDKLVEHLANDLRRVNSLNSNTVAKALFEQGYRKIKPMSEKEFMKQCVDICYHADTRLYRAGCRFLDQGE